MTALDETPITKACLETDLEMWPTGIGTNSDGAAVYPPLDLSWRREVEKRLAHAPVIHRNKVIILTQAGLFRKKWFLVCLDLRDGGQCWQTELGEGLSSRIVAADGVVFLRDQAKRWYLYDLETGKRLSDIESPADLVRQQLKLATVSLEKPHSYCRFFPSITHPGWPRSFLLASRQDVVFSGVTQEAGLIAYAWNGILVNWSAHWLRFEVVATPAEVVSASLDSRFMFVGLRNHYLSVIDVSSEKYVPRYEIQTPVKPKFVSTGCGHVLVAEGQSILSYRSADEAAWNQWVTQNSKFSGQRDRSNMFLCAPVPDDRVRWPSACAVCLAQPTQLVAIRGKDVGGAAITSVSFGGVQSCSEHVNQIPRAVTYSQGKLQFENYEFWKLFLDLNRLK